MATSKMTVKPSRPTSTFDSQANCIKRRRAMEQLSNMERAACMPSRRGEVAEIGVILRYEDGVIAGVSYVNNCTSLG